MQHPTLKDLAQDLGLSVSTISRAFQPASDISRATRQRVLERAKAVGYHPNPVAQRLHQRYTFQVGVIVPELTEGFFGQVLQGMQAILAPAGYQLLITQAGENTQQAEHNLRQLVANRVDGLLLSLSQDCRDLTYLQQLVQQGMPLVMFNRVAMDLPVPKVIFNDRKWAQFATEHLIQQGCRQILHLGGNPHVSLSQARAEGYRQAMKKYRLEPREVVVTGFGKVAGEQAMADWLRTGHELDGIFAVNDPVAMGAMLTLQQQGIAVPGEVAVMGFSASPWGEWVSPSLSSVAQPTLALGKKSAQTLLQQLKGEVPPPCVFLEGELLTRDSSLRKP